MKCLVTAIGSMSAESVIQAISLQPGVEVVGCDMHPMEWAAASRLINRFYLVPPARNETAYIFKLLEICRLETISHLIPLTDPEVDVLSANMLSFHEAGVIICVSPQSAIRTARDKLAVAQEFSQHPRIRSIPTADLQDATDFDFLYPMLAKPRWGRSSEGQVHIPDVAALKFWRTRLAEQAYVIQPLYSGDVFVVDVVRQPDGSRLAAMTRQELLRTSSGAGMSVRMCPGHVCDALATEAADILGLCGCVNMEFLVVDGSPLLMDVNPRFSAGVAFSMMSGYDMAANHLRCFDGGVVEPCQPPPDKIYVRGSIEYSLQD